jgi:hypothetical protein
MVKEILTAPVRATVEIMVSLKEIVTLAQLKLVQSQRLLRSAAATLAAIVTLVAGVYGAILTYQAGSPMLALEQLLETATQLAEAPEQSQEGATPEQ